MTTIDKTQPLVTLINIHICKPEDQEQLVKLLTEGWIPFTAIYLVSSLPASTKVWMVCE